MTTLYKVQMLRWSQRLAVGEAEWKGPSRLDGKLVLIKAHGFGTAAQAPGAHEHQFAPGPEPHTALSGVSPGELLKLLVGAKSLTFKGGGKK